MIDLKHEISKVTAIPVEKQILKYLHEEKHLKDHKTLEYYGVVNDMFVRLELKAAMMTQQVYIKTPSGEIFPLKVKESDDVSSLKSKIFARESYPTSLQRLVYKGEFLTEEKMLKDCKVERDSTIELFLNFHFRVVSLSSSLQFYVGMEATVAKLKHRIEEEFGILKLNQQLFIPSVSQNFKGA